MVFDCIMLDEAHHSSAGTYRKVMNYFKPKLFLGITATFTRWMITGREKAFMRY